MLLRCDEISLFLAVIDFSCIPELPAQMESLIENLTFCLAVARTLPASASLTTSTASSAASTLGVFDKSPEERAETAGLGVLRPRESALPRWLWNRVENQ